MTVLLHSYTTARVNFITWNKAYSIFPIQTLIHHKCYALQPLDYDVGFILREQSDQGWTSRDMIWLDLDISHRCLKPSGHRRIGDRASIVIPLELKDVRPVSTPDSAVEYAQFEVTTEPARPFRESYENHQVRSDTLSSPALRSVHMYSSDSWYKFLVRRLERWTLCELSKLESEERPALFAVEFPDSLHLSDLQDVQLPDSWDYADDQIPEWYSEWEQSTMEERAKKQVNQDRRRGRGF